MTHASHPPKVRLITDTQKYLRSLRSLRLLSFLSFFRFWYFQHSPPLNPASTEQEQPASAARPGQAAIARPGTKGAQRLASGTEIPPGENNQGNHAQPGSREQGAAARGNAEGHQQWPAVATAGGEAPAAGRRADRPRAGHTGRVRGSPGSAGEILASAGMQRPRRWVERD